MNVDPSWLRDRLNNLDPADPQWAEKFELDLAEHMTGTRPTVRHDCAFCHRERTPKDDNHAPGCFVWAIFPKGRPSMTAVDERGHSPAVCSNEHCNGCQFCAGGLYGCSVCMGLEGSMPTNCPGQQMTPTQVDEVYAGRIDYRDGLWVNAASPDSPGGAR